MATQVSDKLPAVHPSTGSSLKPVPQLLLLRNSGSFRCAAHRIGATRRFFTATIRYYSQFAALRVREARRRTLRLLRNSRNFDLRVTPVPQPLRRASVVHDCDYYRIVAVTFLPALLPNPRAARANCEYYGIVAMSARAANCCFFQQFSVFVTPLLRRYRPFAGETALRAYSLGEQAPWTPSQDLSQPLPSMDEP